MAKVSFVHYLHDNYTRWELEHTLVEQEGVDPFVAEEIAETRPFYEVTLECEYDTETKRTTILKAY
jgi:hypothetical protein